MLAIHANPHSRFARPPSDGRGPSKSATLATMPELGARIQELTDEIDRWSGSGE